MTEHNLTETRELMLRFLAGRAGFPGRYPVEINPLFHGMPQAQSWLIAHGYLDPLLVPTAKGLEAALELGSDHRPRIERAQVGKRRTRSVLNGVYGTRVRCSCGWGGWPRQERLTPKDWVIIDKLPSEGGYTEGVRLHAEHANKELG